MGAVRFVKAWSLYNPGETATFDDETTSLLIDSGTAVFADEAEPAKPAKKGKKAPAPAAADTDTSEGRAEPAGEAA